MTELRAEQERILAMPGRVGSVKLARLHRTAKIFRGNALALLDHLRRMDDLDQMLATTSDQQAFEEFLDEAKRHLHNYVAAAQSRVDHFRRFSRKDMPEGLREEYQQRVDQEFDASPLHKLRHRSAGSDPARALARPNRNRVMGARRRLGLPGDGEACWTSSRP